MVPGLKALASVDDISLIHGGSWRLFGPHRCLLGKVGHSLGVWRARCSQTDGYCWSLDDVRDIWSGLG